MATRSPARSAGRPNRAARPSSSCAPERAGQPALAPGERVLAKLKPIGAGQVRGHHGQARRRRRPGPGARRLREWPASSRPTAAHKAEWVVPPGEAGGAGNGEIVLAEPLPGRDLGLRPARIVEVLGQMGEAKSVSLICIHAHGIPDIFPTEAVREAEHATRRRRRRAARTCATSRWSPSTARMPATSTTRSGPSRTATAGACSSPSPTSRITSVPARRWTARPGRAATACYFPDRVVPMLPEALSNGWCSLRPGEDRGCLFVEMRFDARRHEIRPPLRPGHHAQRRAADLRAGPGGARRRRRPAAGPSSASTPPTAPCWRRASGAARSSSTCRSAGCGWTRPGTVLGVAPRAAPRQAPADRGIHGRRQCLRGGGAGAPARSPACTGCTTGRRTRSWRGCGQFLDAFDISLPQGDRSTRATSPMCWSCRRHGRRRGWCIETVLRSQSQAAYAPENIGHFGLALGRYAHFTSPIRRYADLLVHRALVRGLKLGAGGLQETEAARFPDTGEHITQTERRAAAAERDAVDRYLAAYMSQRIGEVFDARISGVTRFGLFVTVEANGASGIVPSRVPAGRPMDRGPGQAQTLSGQRTGITFTLGQAVEARLVEATPGTGGMVFHLMQGMPAPGPAQAEPRPRRRRPRRQGKAPGALARDPDPAAAAAVPARRRRAGRARSRASRCRRCWPPRSAPCWSGTWTSPPRPSSASGACAASRCWSRPSQSELQSGTLLLSAPDRLLSARPMPACPPPGPPRGRGAAAGGRRCPACSTPPGAPPRRSAGPGPNACCAAPSRSCSTTSTPIAAT